MSNVKRLGFDYKSTQRIENVVAVDHIKWELWTESASSYKDLVGKLTKRGYTNLPISDKPELANFRPGVDQAAINKLPNQQTMMRRGKH